MNRVFGSACAAGADRIDVLQGLERLLLVVPPLLFALGLLSVVGVERPVNLPSCRIRLRSNGHCR